MRSCHLIHQFLGLAASCIFFLFYSCFMFYISFITISEGQCSLTSIFVVKKKRTFPHIPHSLPLWVWSPEVVHILIVVLRSMVMIFSGVIMLLALLGVTVWGIRAWKEVSSIFYLWCSLRVTHPFGGVEYSWSCISILLVKTIDSRVDWTGLWALGGYQGWKPPPYALKEGSSAIEWKPECLNVSSKCSSECNLSKDSFNINVCPPASLFICLWASSSGILLTYITYHNPLLFYPFLQQMAGFQFFLLAEQYCISRPTIFFIHKSVLGTVWVAARFWWLELVLQWTQVCGYLFKLVLVCLDRFLEHKFLNPMDVLLLKVWTGLQTICHRGWNQLTFPLQRFGIPKNYTPDIEKQLHS